jgi:hypothetical protein
MLRSCVEAVTWAATSALAQNVSADELDRRAIERRAVGADTWGMPAVNCDLMRQEMLTKTTAKENKILYSSRPCTLPAPLPVE